MSILRPVIIISFSCIAAGIIYLSAMLTGAYFPAHVIVNPVQKYAIIFVAVFLSIAALELIRASKNKFTGKAYFGAQAYIDVFLGLFVVFTIFAGQIKIESSKTVRLGSQTFQFSSLDYPIANEFQHGAKPLFTLDGGTLVHSVYLGFQRDYDFDRFFPDENVRGFHSAIHAPNSPHLDEVEIKSNSIILNRGSIWVDEGNYVLEFFPTHGMSSEGNSRFLKFITDNITEIRASHNARHLPTPDHSYQLRS